jgi:hypothetical protein
MGKNKRLRRTETVLTNKSRPNNAGNILNKHKKDVRKKSILAG